MEKKYRYLELHILLWAAKIKSRCHILHIIQWLPMLDTCVVNIMDVLTHLEKDH